jgi:hypothetical protein
MGGVNPNYLQLLLGCKEDTHLSPAVSRVEGKMQNVYRWCVIKERKGSRMGWREVQEKRRNEMWGETRKLTFKQLC